MAQFEVLKAVAVPISMDNVDTDQIFPSRFSSKDRADGKYGDYLLHDQRFDKSGHLIGSFILNDERYHGAKIIVASENYACGSARPGAIYSHLDYGICAIVAESFGPVFPTVAYKSGLLTVQVCKDTAQRIRGSLLHEPGSQVEIDLKQQVIGLADGQQFRFDIDFFIKKMFMEGVSEIELTLRHKSKIEEFEAGLQKSFPWIYRIDR